MARSREAIATIKGYYYQFDYFILQLLYLPNDTDTVCIEGIEDVDVTIEGNKDVIQCKYYEGTTCSPSVIAKAIRPMVQHFSTNRHENISYKLYGRYASGEETIPIPLTIDFLKNKLLTFKKDKITHVLHEELNIDDEVLHDFLHRFSLMLRAEDYDDQVNHVITQLRQKFQCSDFEAKYFFYNNALNFVKSVAVKANQSDRIVSKECFLREINTKRVIFDEWYKERVGYLHYYKEAKKEFFSLINISPADRLFLIECDSSIADQDLVRLIMEVSKRWSKFSAREPLAFCPYFFFYKILPNRMIRLKKLLFNNDFHIWDGHEFLGAEFSSQSLLRNVSNVLNIRAKIINEIHYIDILITESNRRKELYQFYLLEPFYERKNIIGADLQIQNTIDVLKIL